MNSIEQDDDIADDDDSDDTFFRKPMPMPAKKRSNFIVKSSIEKIHEISDNSLWIDQFKPSTAMEIALHPAKLKQVRNAIDDALKPDAFKLIVLTGPSGCSKSAAVHVIAKELNVEICEWVNPLDASSFDMNDTSSFDDNEYQHTSIISGFTEFLSTCGKCSSLSLANTNKALDQKIILIEDFPNVSHERTRKRIQSSILAYVSSNRNQAPLILIISKLNLAASDNPYYMNENVVPTFRNIIPNKLITEGKLVNIQFNSVAPGILIKAISKLLGRFTGPHIPTVNEIEAIAMNSGGDVRCAINALQFFCCNKQMIPASNPISNTVAGKKKAGKSKNASGPTTDVSIGSRETSLVLFHALGKILNNKRVEDSSQPRLKFNQSLSLHASMPTSELPDHMFHAQRRPLIFSPEAVFESSHSEAKVFIAFLHQNYLTYYADVDEISMASDYLSMADLYFKRWEDPVLESYASSVAMRGLLYSHTQPIPSHKSLRQIRKPEEWSISRDARDTMLEMRAITDSWRRNKSDAGFRLFEHYDQHTLILDIIPFVGFLKQEELGSYDRHWLKNATLFERSYKYGDYGEFINEKDDVELPSYDASDKFYSLSGAHANGGILLEDDIED